MDDGFLVRQVLAGQRDAFRQLVLRYQRPVFRFLGLLGVRPAAVEDVAQETFLRAFRHLADFDPRRARFSTWLFTIARRLAINEGQRAHNRVEVAEIEPAVDQHADASGQLIERERAARLRRALARLPVRLRAALVMVQMEGLSLDEVATVEGCAVGTIKSRAFRARQLLRDALTKENG